MNDSISRQKAVDAFMTILDKPNHAEFLYTDEICKVLNNLPSEQPEQRWIPCSERIPEKRRETYWVCTDAGSQHECRWTNNVFGIGKSDEWGWSIFDIPQYTKVLAWMPLMEPYKEREAERMVGID